MAAAAGRSDDLETIEGIGPAIAALLRARGIRTFAALAAYRPAELRHILRSDADLARAEPSTWPFQARLLAEHRNGDFVRLIAKLNGGVPRLVNVIDECCAGRLRAGGICTIAELQRSTVSRVVECFPQNDRANITRLAPRWIDHAYRLHEGDEATLCALAGIAQLSGTVRGETRRDVVRTEAAGDSAIAETGLSAYWRRESLLRLLCAPLGGLALLLFLLFIALLGLIPSHNAAGSNVIVGGGGGTTISMIQGGWPPQNGQNTHSWEYGPYGPYPPPYPPYPPYPSPYPPSPYPPYPPYPLAPGSCCPPAATSCNYAPCPAPAPAPAPAPSPARATCDCSSSDSCECSDAY